MMGRSMSGKQFWAVPASDGSRPLVVFDLSATDDFQRIVVAVDNPTEVAAALQRGRRPLAAGCRQDSRPRGLGLDAVTAGGLRFGICASRVSDGAMPPVRLNPRMQSSGRHGDEVAAVGSSVALAGV
jgi:hypothetical protein